MSIEFSVKLSSLRKDKGVSQKEAASSLGVSQALLSHYEKGIRECGLDFVINAAVYYNVSTDYLLGLSKTKKASTGMFDEDSLPEDSQMKEKTVLRCLYFLMNEVENQGEAAQIYFADYFSVCIEKYLSLLRNGNSESPKNKLYELALSLLSKKISSLDTSVLFEDMETPLCINTLNKHCEMLISYAVNEALTD